MKFVAKTAILVFVCTLCGLHAIKGQHPVVSEFNGQSETWEKLAPYFETPDTFRNKYATYRSPLRFYNGREVITKDDWAKRRAEIWERWHKLMGEWPPLLVDQQMELVDSTDKGSFIQYGIRFFWTPNEKTNGYLLVPKTGGKKPAVITVFYEPETAIGLGTGKEPTYRDFALQLAERGFVTLSLGTANASKARTFSIYYPNLEHARVEPLSMLACASANAWYVLAKRPEVDSTRIGIMGHSFGGKWAMFASCLFEKFACAVWSDPGIVFDETKGSMVNYWEPWYLGYYPPPWTNAWRQTGLVPEARGLYSQLIKEGYDLHELHALMAPRPFLVSGGSSDQPERWIPLNWSVKINQLLGYSHRVGMTNRTDHSPNRESNEVAYLFFDYFLNKEKPTGFKTGAFQKL